MQKHPVTAVIIAKNEGANLKQCLPTLSFCQEIIVINNDSNDDTKEVAYEFGVKVIDKKDTDFSVLRNTGLIEAQNPWVLFVDADEIVSQDLKNEIIQVVNNPETKAIGFMIKRRNFFLGHEMKFAEVGNDWILRLAKKNVGQWVRSVHEVWMVKGKLGRLKNSLDHKTANNLSDFLDKTIYFAKLHAQANIAEGKKASLFKVLFYPKYKFIKSYLLKQGWRDGVYGLVYTMIMAFHSFLAWGDAWVLQKKSAKG